MDFNVSFEFDKLGLKSGKDKLDNKLEKNNGAEDVSLNSDLNSDESETEELTLEDAKSCIIEEILKEILDDKKLDLEYEKKLNNSENNLKKEKKKLKYKYGDWICLFCFNYNFAFRNACNKCKKSKEETFKLYQKIQMPNKIKS